MGVKVYDGTSGEWVEFGGAGSSAANINNNADNRVITGSNTPGELNAEEHFTYDAATSTLAMSHPTEANRIEIGNDATDGTTGKEHKFAFIDLKSGSGYPDYAVRLIRFPGADGTDGKNTRTDLLHRGTADFRIAAEDNGSISLTDATRILFEANKFDFAPLNTTQSAVNPFLYQGFTIVTTITRTPGAVYDTGISVSQGNGGGMALLMSSGNNDKNLSGVGCRLDLIRFAVYGSFNGNHVAPDLHNISATGGGGGVVTSVGKSAQNTLTISVNKQGRWTLLMMGENIITSI